MLIEVPDGRSVHAHRDFLNKSMNLCFGLLALGMQRLLDFAKGMHLPPEKRVLHLYGVKWLL